MTPEQKLTELGITLPDVAAPVGAYVPAVRAGNLVITSGQLPTVGGKLISAGKCGQEVSVEDAQAAGVQAVKNALAAIRAQVGSLNAVKQVVRLNVFVNSAAGFTDQSKVANGPSELLADIFGDAGKHTRCAVGIAELPMNASVEVDMTVLVD